MWKKLFSATQAQRLQKQQIFLYGLLIWLGLVEVVAFLFPTVGKIGLWSWLLSWLVVVLVLARPVEALVLATWRERQFGWLIALTVLLVVWGFQLVSNRTVGGESTQETSCGLFLMAKPNAGFQQSCLFGYPARQHYLPSLPSLWFGRSIVPLNVGNSLYVLIGLMACLAGVWRYWQQSRRVWWGLLFIVLALPQFYFFQHFFYFRFEQSIFPFAFGLLGIGWWLLYRASFDQRYSLLLVLWLYHLLFAYTPTLSLVLVGLGALAVVMWESYPRSTDISKHWQWWSMWLSLAITGLIGLGVSFFSRHDINLVDKTGVGSQSIQTSLTQLLTILITPNFHKAFFSPIFQLGFWWVLCWLVMIKKRWWSWLLAGWIALTIVAAVLAKGYAYYHVSFRLHRAMVVMPIVIVGLVAWLMETPWRLRIWHMWLLTMLLVVSGSWQYYDYFKQSNVEKNYVLATQLHQQLNPNFSESHIEMIFIGESHSVYRPINDWLKYFDPAITVVWVDTKTACASQPKTQYILLPTDHACNQVWQDQGWQPKRRWQTLDGWEADLLAK